MALLSLPQINPGCDVPPEYYLTNLTETSREEMERIVVGRARTHEVEYSVALPGSVLRFVLWQLGETWGKNFARSSLLASIPSSSSSPLLFLLLSLSPPSPPLPFSSSSSSFCRWEFVSTDYDVGFGWFFKSKGKQRKIKLKKEVVRQLHATEESQFLCWPLNFAHLRRFLWSAETVTLFPRVECTCAQ